MTLADALEAHEASLSVGGGRRGISNLSNIEGALGRPYHGYHPSIELKAAALLHGMATSHGFTDGNKRTSWLVTLILIEASEYTLELEPNDYIDDVVVNVVEGTMTEGQLVEWFNQRIK